MCLYPTLIKNKKYTSNKKNGGNIPPLIDHRVQYVPIGCQDCIECRNQKARGWQIRLQEDIKTHTNGKFVTLTFSNESILKLIQESKERAEESTAKRKIIDLTKITGYALDNAIATTAIRLFLERYRKQYKTSLRHFLITEIGHKGTENIHLHGIIWPNQSLDIIEKIWTYGYIWKGKIVKKTRNNPTGIQNYVNAKTVNYIIKYITKRDEIHPTYQSIILTSAGIGSNYTNTYDAKKNKFNNEKTTETYRTSTGHKMAMPNYWRNKIYTEEEKEKLWLHKIDKQIRWICGEKVDISKTEQHYYQLLEYHQKRNRKLGYGNGERTWEQREYEQQRRNLRYEERKKAAQRSKAASLQKGETYIKINSKIQKIA